MRNGLALQRRHDNLTAGDRAFIAGLGRPAGRKRHQRTDGRHQGGLVCLAPPPGHAARLEAHEARIAADPAAKVEPAIVCWGPCGRSLPRGSTPGVHGWHVRDVVLTGFPMHEVQCGECHAAWGWIEPQGVTA
jgi:hypothetical protein